MSTDRVAASGTVVHGRAAFNSRAIAPGECAPLGARLTAGGVNFSLFSRDADLVELLLFDGPQAIEPAETIPLDPAIPSSPTTTGTRSFPASRPDRSTGTARMDRRRPNAASASMRTRSCSIRTAWRSRSPTATRGTPRAVPATTPPPR